MHSCTEGTLAFIQCLCFSQMSIFSSYFGVSCRILQIIPMFWDFPEWYYCLRAVFYFIFHLSVNRTLYTLDLEGMCSILIRLPNVLSPIFTTHLYKIWNYKGEIFIEILISLMFLIYLPVRTLQGLISWDFSRSAWMVRNRTKQVPEAWQEICHMIKRWSGDTDVTSPSVTHKMNSKSSF